MVGNGGRMKINDYISESYKDIVFAEQIKGEILANEMMINHLKLQNKALEIKLRELLNTTKQAGEKNEEDNHIS